MADFGISAALLTPFRADGDIDLALFCRHARDLLNRGTKGVTAFGTTGEGASIGLKERAHAIAALLESGVPPSKITLGVSSSAGDDALAQIQQGIDARITDFLLLPPFYFKGVADDGLFDWHGEVFNAADHRARFVLYHIPQVSNVPLSFDLVMRMTTQFPDRIKAIKDSSGSWGNTRALLDSGKIPVLVGDERLLHKAAAFGAVGSICGMANLYPERMSRLFETQQEDLSLSREVDHIVSVPVIPALKLILAIRTGNNDWVRTRPPLQPLAGNDRDTILSAFATRTPA